MTDNVVHMYGYNGKVVRHMVLVPAPGNRASGLDQRARGFPVSPFTQQGRRPRPKCLEPPADDNLSDIKRQYIRKLWTSAYPTRHHLCDKSHENEYGRSHTLGEFPKGSGNLHKGKARLRKRRLLHHPTRQEEYERVTEAEPTSVHFKPEERSSNTLSEHSSDPKASTTKRQDKVTEILAIPPPRDRAYSFPIGATDWSFPANFTESRRPASVSSEPECDVIRDVVQDPREEDPMSRVSNDVLGTALNKSLVLERVPGKPPCVRHARLSRSLVSHGLVPLQDLKQFELVGIKLAHHRQ